MIRNYLTIALRILWKNKAFSLINITGLALGITAFILILEYVTFERSTNQFHSNLPQLYRVLLEDGKNNSVIYDLLPPALGPVVQSEFGEIKDFCRLADNGQGVVTYEEDGQQNLKSFRENDIVYADGSFFSMFSFPVLLGDKNSFGKPNTIAISASQARKYFDDAPPINKILTINNQFGKTIYEVVAVFEDFPDNSDLQYDIILSLETLANPANLNGNNWAALDNFDSNFISTFLLLQSNVSHILLEQKLNAFKKQLKPESEEIVRLQPMVNMHLAATLQDHLTTYGSLKFVYLLGGLAILIIIIAWFNYVNLSTAGSMDRAKEVGLRKVAGAYQTQLIIQFLGESFLLNVIGFVLAILFILLGQNFYNQLLGKSLSLDIFQQNNFWISGLLFLIVGAIGSGAYKAFILASFKPIDILKGTFSRSAKGTWLRKALVIFQFGISMVLLSVTLITFSQLKFMRSQNLGMDLNQLLVIKGPEVGRNDTFVARSNSFQHQLAQLSFVEDFCTSGSVPGNWFNFSATGIARPNASVEDKKKSYSITIVDNKFLDTYGISLLAGSNFTDAMLANNWENNDKIMINETAARELGFSTPTDAVGQMVDWGKSFEVVAVVKDYHHQSLQQAIVPIVFIPQRNTNYFTIKLTTEDLQAKIKKLQSLYNQSFPENPFDYFFQDENYDKQYQDEQRYSAIFSVAAILAIFIACLGLFGLTLFTVQKRTKEIGIRKILGAPVASILLLISKDYIQLIAIAFLIAIPIANYFISDWLQNFAYHIDIKWWLFGIPGCLVLFLALFAVSGQTIKAATQNPVDSLRTE